MGRRRGDSASRLLDVIACTLLLAACGGDARTTDASLPDATTCCAIADPTCDCFQIGGSPEHGQCPAICDAEPDGWVQDVDENGCPVLRWVGGTGSCIPVWDAGVAPDAS